MFVLVITRLGALFINHLRHLRVRSESAVWATPTFHQLPDLCTMVFGSTLISIRC